MVQPSSLNSRNACVLQLLPTAMAIDATSALKTILKRTAHASNAGRGLLLTHLLTNAIAWKRKDTSPARPTPPPALLVSIPSTLTQSSTNASPALRDRSSTSTLLDVKTALLASLTSMGRVAMFVLMEGSGTQLKRSVTTVSRVLPTTLQLVSVCALLKPLIWWMVLSASAAQLLSTSTPLLRSARAAKTEKSSTLSRMAANAPRISFGMTRNAFHATSPNTLTTRQRSASRALRTSSTTPTVKTVNGALETSLSSMAKPAWLVLPTSISTLALRLAKTVQGGRCMT